MSIIKVDIISDPICPWCYIGKKRFEQALSSNYANNIEVSWRSFQLNPNLPVDGIKRLDYLEGKFGSIKAADSIFANIYEVGVKNNIEFAFDSIKKTPNTINAHRLIGWSSLYDLQDKVVTKLFESYFENGQDIGCLNILFNIATSCGLPKNDVVKFLESDKGYNNVLSECNAASKMGITGVPFFILNGEYYISGAQDPEVFIKAFNSLKSK
tara:strand:- start:21233 stop:21868 length:636 start_codon:yes stop_codon:yes gene_type:complete